MRGVLVGELLGVLGIEVLGALLQCGRVQLGQQHGESRLGQQHGVLQLGQQHGYRGALQLEEQ